MILKKLNMWPPYLTFAKIIPMVVLNTCPLKFLSENRKRPQRCLCIPRGVI